MSEKPSGEPRKGLPPIVFLVLGFTAVWGLQSQLLRLLGWRPSLPAPPGQPSVPAGGGGESPGAQLAGATTFPLQASVPAGTTISIDGSTSMVLINEGLKAGFFKAYPVTVVETAATGSDNGIQALLGGMSVWRPHHVR
jgi:phosphate transport system substrate-binding protein